MRPARASLLRVELDIHRGMEALLVGLRPRVAALLLLGLCGIFPALRLTFRRVAFGFLRLYGTGRPSGSRHELHAALLHVHLQSGDELPAVVALDELVAHGQSGAEHILLLLGDFRLADALRDAYLARRNVRDLIRLAVDADVGGDNLARFPAHNVHDCRGCPSRAGSSGRRRRICVPCIHPVSAPCG